MNINIKRNPWVASWEHTSKRYVFIKGGRGSGKTTEVALTLVLLALRSTERFIILCCREVQKSLSDSTYESIQKAVRTLKKENEFKFLLNKIVCKRNGIRFLFYGLKTNPENVMSMEDIRYCWVEQAEKVSENSLQILLPSVDRSAAGTGRIFFTWNPYYKNDPIEQYARRYKDYSVRVNVSYFDNIFFPRGLDIERKICSESMPEFYDHIWRGQYIKQNANVFLLPLDELDATVNIAHKFNYDVRRIPFSHAGLDMSDEGADYPALAIKKGSYLVIAKNLRKGNAVQVCEEIMPTFLQQKVAKCYYDAGGVGAALKAEFFNLRRQGKLFFSINPILFGASVGNPNKIFMRTGLGQTTNKEQFYRLNAQMYWNLRQRLKNTLQLIAGAKPSGDRYLFIDKSITREALKQLSQVTFMYDKDRQIRIDKKGGNSKSPDIADAIAMAFAQDCESGLEQ